MIDDIIKIKAHGHHYRPAAGICLINADGKVFVGSAYNYPGKLIMPQGGIQLGENAVEAAFRELYEETSVMRAVPIAALKKEQSYLYPEKRGKHYDGQRMIWTYLFHHGDENEIHLGPKAVAEFTHWSWATSDEVMKRASGCRARVYENVMDGLLPILRAMTIMPPIDGRKEKIGGEQAHKYVRDLADTFPMIEAEQNGLLTDSVQPRRPVGELQLQQLIRRYQVA